MCANGYAVLARYGDGVLHDEWIAAVETAGHVRGRDQRQQRLIGSQAASCRNSRRSHN